MRLDVYMRLHRIPQGEMAKILGVTRTHIHMISMGKSIPSRKMAKRIDEITNGAVSRLESLYPNEIFTNCEVS